MATKLPYLTQSKTGWYEYRRRVPDSLRASFGNKREFKKSLRTNSLKEAAGRWQVAHSEYEATAARFRRLGSAGGVPLSDDLVKEAAIRAETLARPTLRAGASHLERMEFEEAEDLWLLNIENLKYQLEDTYTDHDQLKRDYDEGRFFRPGYQAPLVPDIENDPNLLALKHIEKGASLDLAPTWRDATENYLLVNSSDKARDQAKQATFEKKMRSLFDKFGLSLGKQRSQTPLEAITRQTARAFKDQFGISTGNRYNNILSAVINCWNREFSDKTVRNPFSGLSNKRLEDKHSRQRKSFSPKQWLEFVEILESWPNREIGLIGLIMAYTGCRPSEAAGLSVKDVRLDDGVPNLVFRSNKVRSMDKGGLERAVPIFEPLTTHLRAYASTQPRGESFFSKYGAPKHLGNISVQLNNILRKKLNIMDKGLVAYSFRHTIHDRGRSARVETSVHEYIVGHLSTGSSRIHQRYGTRTPARALVEDMELILAQKTWDTDFD